MVHHTTPVLVLAAFRKKIDQVNFNLFSPFYEYFLPQLKFIKNATHHLLSISVVPRVYNSVS